jgi:phage FluMu protein Com
MLTDNHYTHCNKSWTTEDCDSFHNDKCPKCGSEITPTESTEHTENGTKQHYHT